MAVAPIPRDPSPDSTLALLRDGYRFISERCRRHGSDVFETRLMLRRAVCVLGEEAARMFYAPDRFTRRGAMPITALRLLQDEGSVALLDGAAHRWRKGMFLSLMSPAGLHGLVEAMTTRWRARIPWWGDRGQVVLLDEMQALLCGAVCAWAGVPLAPAEERRRAHEFGAMVAGAGAVGPRALRGLRLRHRTERWIRDVVARIRAGALDVPAGTAAHVIAWHREPDGALLAPGAAAVELINVLRPTVAVARYVVFAALALHEHPACRERLAQALRAGDDAALDRFVQEVRRFYPFFPFVGGRALRAFEWRGHRFPEGAWVLLDLYGTNHDVRLWGDPEVFRPERFGPGDAGAFRLIPQGGGAHDHGHRCAGEGPTLELLKQAVRLLTTATRYDVPAQDLRVDLSRLPAAPRSGFVIRNVRPAP